MAGRLSKQFEDIAKGQTKRPFKIFDSEEASYLKILIGQISPDPNQPRRDLGDLSELKASIKEHGVLQPIIVSPNGLDRYIIIAGERRFTAAKEVGLKAIPAISRTIEEHERLEFQLVENLHRKDLNPLEEAESYKRLMDEFNLTQEAVAKRIGKSVASVNETLRLLDLPESLKGDFRTSEKVSKSLLLEVVKQPSEEKQVALWERAKEGNLTVKEARQEKNKKQAQRAKQGQETIRTDGAVITIRFRKSAVTKKDVRRVLEEALASL